MTTEIPPAPPPSLRERILERIGTGRHGVFVQHMATSLDVSVGEVEAEVTRMDLDGLALTSGRGHWPPLSVTLTPVGRAQALAGDVQRQQNTVQGPMQRLEAWLDERAEDADRSFSLAASYQDHLLWSAQRDAYSLMAHKVRLLSVRGPR